MSRSFLFFLIGLSLLIPEGSIQAHPMGNFSINHYSGIEVGEMKIRLRYILDLAEIPAFQEIQEIDADRDGTVSLLERERYLSRKIGALATGLVLKINGAQKPLTSISHELDFPPGAGGLPTMRLSILYHAENDSPEKMSRQTGTGELFYQDNNYLNRAGWKEMAATGAGVTLIDSPLPTTGGELRAYPEQPQSLPQILEVRFSFKQGPAGPSNPSLLPESNGGKVFLRNDRFTALMTGSAPQGSMRWLSLLIAFGLGALHALSPGHGKTVVAAYLVGSRGTAWHAFLLGAIVTFSHTIGVFVLGIVTLYLSEFFLPERLYPWLGFFSGLVILMIGLSLFRQRWQLLLGDHPPEGPPHDELPHHHDHPHSNHPHGHDHHDLSGDSFSRLLGLGVTGGIIPCPSALVVSLGHLIAQPHKPKMNGSSRRGVLGGGETIWGKFPISCRRLCLTDRRTDFQKEERPLTESMPQKGGCAIITDKCYNKNTGGWDDFSRAACLAS